MKLRCFKKIKKLFSFLLIFLSILQIAVSAEGPYNNYSYDPYDEEEAIPTAAGYLPEELITGDTLGIGNLKTPRDLYYDNDKYLYVLDSGNNRVIVLTKDLKKERIILPTDKE